MKPGTHLGENARHREVSDDQATPYFYPEFKREAASLVLDQGYSHIEAARSLGLVESALRRRVSQLQQERGGVTPTSKALTPEQQKILELEARINLLEREKSILKGYRALDGRGTRALALVDELRSEKPVELLCWVFEVTRSCYYAYCHKRRYPDAERVFLRSRVNELFTQSRSAAGSRSIVLIMKEDGMQIGRFKVRKLMREMNLISKQRGSHAYKRRPWSGLIFRTCLIEDSPSHPQTRSGTFTSDTSGLEP